MTTMQKSTFSNFHFSPVTNKLTFDINGMNSCLPNAIRRVILSEIPNVAIHFDPYNASDSDIEFIENTSCLHNEMLGHRISLIPLCFSEEQIEEYDPSKYNFAIIVHNTTKEHLSVTTNDIRVYDENGNEYPDSVRRSIFPVSYITHDPILINVLNPNLHDTNMGDKLWVKFKARKGVAIDHARYCPVSTCSLSNIIDDEKASIGLIEYITKNGTDTHGKSVDQTVLKTRFYNNDVYRYFKTDEYGEANAFHFIIESECRLSPKYLVSKALDVLISKLHTMLEKQTYKITHLGDNAFAILIQNEQETLGNVVQDLMFNMCVKDDKSLTYIGYYVPHPLIPEVVVKLTFSDPESKTIDDVDCFFEQIINMIIKEIVLLQLKWKNDYEFEMEQPSKVIKKKK